MQKSITKSQRNFVILYKKLCLFFIFLTLNYCTVFVSLKWRVESWNECCYNKGVGTFNIFAFEFW